MNTRLGGSNAFPSPSVCVGRSNPPSRYKSVLFPDPLAPTIDTYSRASMKSDTPLRMCVAISPAPRVRCTFCARSNGSRRAREPSGSAAGCSAIAAKPATESLGSRLAREVLVSMRPTNHLHRIVLCRPSRRIHRREQGHEHRADERLNVLARVLAHQQSFNLHQPFHLNRQPSQSFDRDFSDREADARSDQPDHQTLQHVNLRDIVSREAEAF